MRAIIIISAIIILQSCSAKRVDKSPVKPEDLKVIETNISAAGNQFELEFYEGKSFYYPLMAVWLESMDGNFIQSLYVPESVATSVFKFGTSEKGEWKPGIRRWPQTLPYWAHKRGVLASDGLYMPEPENPVPDAYSGATPVESFKLMTRSDRKLSGKYRILLELNQNWDWNEYWTNNRYPDDEYYKRSCQPALVYEALVDFDRTSDRVLMKPIGHSHHSGATGELFKDLGTITTALQIADSIIVRY